MIMPKKYDWFYAISAKNRLRDAGHLKGTKRARIFREEGVRFIGPRGRLIKTPGGGLFSQTRRRTRPDAGTLSQEKVQSAPWRCTTFDRLFGAARGGFCCVYFAEKWRLRSMNISRLRWEKGAKESPFAELSPWPARLFTKLSSPFSRLSRRIRTTNFSSWNSSCARFFWDFTLATCAIVIGTSLSGSCCGVAFRSYWVVFRMLQWTVY